MPSGSIDCTIRLTRISAASLGLTSQIFLAMAMNCSMVCVMLSLNFMQLGVPFVYLHSKGNE